MSDRGRDEGMTDLALEAMDLEGDARTAFVSERCLGDPAREAALLGRIRELEEADAFFHRMASRAGALLLASPADPASVTPEGEAPLPEKLGPYRVLGRLGQGGMGVVYLAEREDRDYRMKVAVKVLHPHLAAGPFRERFVAERRILAGLSHPGIARLMDGGVLPDGSPYLVMEHVDGEDLVRWADARQLPIRERVRLFLQVCRAVEYAHGKLVVHRDLKPSNTRVTPDGTVKLLDFGIARVLDPELSDEVTRVDPQAPRPLTPAYASPEQLRGEIIGTASDVYSLGLLLWRLVSGESPGRLRADASGRSTAGGSTGRSTLEGTMADLSELDPGRSLRARGLLESMARVRGTTGAGLERALRGDLAAILRRCVRPEPEDRYVSAAELKDDLLRFLDGRPVIARAGSRRYRVRKFMVRHRWPVAAGAAALVALVAGIGGLAAHSARLAVERDRATQEAERAQAVTEFLVDLFAVAGEGTPLDTVRAGALLAAGEDRLYERTATHPRIRASLLEALVRANTGLGRTEDAQRLRDAWVRALEEHYGPDHLEVARGWAQVGFVARGGNQWARSLAALDKALRILEAMEARGELVEDADRRLLARVLGESAGPLRHLDQVDSALANAHRALEMQRGLEVSDPALLSTMVDLGYALRGAGRLEETEEVLLAVLASMALQDEPDLAMAGLVQNNLGSLLRAMGRLEEAELYFRESLEARRAHEGRDGMTTETVVTNLTLLLGAMGRRDEARAFADSFRIELLETHPPDHWRVGRAHLRLAAPWDETGGCTPRALTDIEAGVAVYEQALGSDHVWTALAVGRQAMCLGRLGRGAEAEPLLRRVLPILAAQNPPNALAVESFAGFLAEYLETTGRTDEAARVREAWGGMSQGVSGGP